VRDRRRLPAAVAIQRRVGGEQLDQRLDVAVLPRGDEAPGDLVSLLARNVEAAPALLHPATGPHQDLTAVVGALPDDVGDLVERVVKDLAEQEGGTLDRGELLEQVEERERERVSGLGVHDRLVLHQRLGKPFAGIHLALDARRAEVVDREPRRHGREPGLRGLGLDIGRVVAEERLLDDVLRLGDRPEHPVGDREEVGPKLLEGFHHEHRRNSSSARDAVTERSAFPSPG
jgi:hypothetical protein